MVRTAYQRSRCAPMRGGIRIEIDAFAGGLCERFRVDGGDASDDLCVHDRRYPHAVRCVRAEPPDAAIPPALNENSCGEQTDGGEELRLDGHAPTRSKPRARRMRYGVLRCSG